MKPVRGYESLRRYRTDLEGVSYFVTVCTRGRKTGLNLPVPGERVVEELHAMASDRAAFFRSWVIMPDHLHLFVNATGKLSLGQVIGRLKAKTRPALGNCGLAWQGNFYEHRIRSGDRKEEVLRYLFLNPYQADLIATTERYPYFWLCEDDQEWFRPTLDDKRPFPEWLV